MQHFGLSRRLRSYSYISTHPHFLHNLPGTPADAEMIPPIRTTFTFRLRLWGYGDYVVTIFFAQTAALFIVFPEMAVTAVVWLVWGMDDLTQKSNLQSFRFTHEFWA